jgi:hypothetical protein
MKVEYRPASGIGPGRAITIINGKLSRIEGDAFEIARRLVENRDRRSRMLKRQARVCSRRVAHRSSI